MSPHNESTSATYGSHFGLSTSYHTRQSSSRVSIDSTSTGASLEGEVRSRPLVPGVYVPTFAFFHAGSEDVDVELTAAHAVRLAESGVAGLATQGSNGEAVNLSHAERKLITRTTRDALDRAGFLYTPIIVGCGAQSTRETLELCRAAASAGGDYALVLPPSYFKGLFNESTVFEFFEQVADASPIPLVIYNYPAGANGIDLSSDIISKLALHPNIAGTKLTCGNTGKLNRVAASPAALAGNFTVFGGSADFTLQTIIGGGAGIIAGLANLAPKSCVKVINLFLSGNIKEAKRMQAIIARGDWAAIQGGLVGTKAALNYYAGYGGVARRPLPSPTKAENEKWREAFAELMELENTL